MIFDNWHDLEILAKQRHESLRSLDRRVHHGPSKGHFAKIASLLLILVVAFSAVIGGSTLLGAHPSTSTLVEKVTPDTGNPAGLVYITPGNIATLPVGSTFTIQVKVFNMSQFNGWDIQVITPSSAAVINATSLSDTGNILVANTTGGTPFPITRCVNGVGTGCVQGVDRVGVVHSAFADTAFASGNGFLFSVTYRVVSTGSYSPITLYDATISSSDPSGVSHSGRSAAYGTNPNPVGFNGGSSSRAFNS